MPEGGAGWTIPTVSGFITVSGIVLCRSEFLAALRELVNASPSLYPDMVGLTNTENPDDDFWESIRHIQVDV